MIKRLIGLSLLCFAFEAHASINVTTAADENNTNPSACSLREALAMTNSEDASKGIGGCTNSDTTSTIILSNKTTYTLNTALVVQKSVTLQSTQTGDINNTAGTNNPVIQAVGNHRIFCIVNTPNTVGCDTQAPASASTTPVAMSISDINLQGCGSSVICDSKGGIIYNQGKLTLQSSRIYNGVATLGGAIYNENVGNVSATTVEFYNNTAQQGAGFYSVSPSYTIAQSLIRNNVATPNSGFAIYTEISDPKVTAIAAIIKDSTIYSNNAKAANIVAGAAINNATIVKNQGGVTFNAAAFSFLNNSIVAGNGGADCSFIAGDKTPISNILYINSCADNQTIGYTVDSNGKRTDNKDPSDTSRPLSNQGPETLMASGAEGSVCPLPPENGLLCPFRTQAGQFNGFLLPRLLLSYQTLAESPIVNKGSTNCSTVDQRGKTRSLCDIGAIELVIPAGNAQTNGQDIIYGQVPTLDLSAVVGDGQLIPASLCAGLYPNITPPNGQWLDGCVRYSTAPAKGTVSFSAVNSNMTYTPSSNYHGFDKFSFDITTTTSIFSEAANNKIITVTTTIVQSPPSGIESKTVGGGGSLGIYGVFALMGLALRRRLTGGQS